MVTSPFVRVFAGACLLLAAVAASAQDHPCESDNVVVIGGEKAYRKECCAQRPYAARQSPANFTECVDRVKAVFSEQKRSAPGIFYSPHDLKCGDNLDKYLCALGNSWACK
jgi:hypothetical protein